MKVTFSRKIALATSAVSVIVAVLAGSSIQQNSQGGADAARYAAVGTDERSGGLLRLGSATRCDSLDPARSFTPWCGVVFRMFTRNLMAFAGKPGRESLQLKPDLAAHAPEVSNGGLVWKFTLRNNLRWDDGTAVTAQDVRYSIERLYVKDLQSPVPPSILCYLSSCSDGVPDYAGPWKKTSDHLRSITTSGTRSITFTLTRPNAQFVRMLAMPQFGIVQQTREATLRSQGLRYEMKPASTGPFAIVRGKGERVATFVRNPYWEQSGDDIRVPRVDRMEWTLYRTAADANRALLDGVIDLKLDDGLTGAQLTWALNQPRLQNQLDTVPVNAVNYIALIPTAEPLDRLACRQAIAYALNKAHLVRVRGGEQAATVAHSLVPVGVAGWQESYNLYSSGRDESGNVEKAKSKLSECGYPDGFEMNLAFVNLGVGRSIYASVQSSLARVGIVVDPTPFDDFTTFFVKGAGSPEYVKNNQVGAVIASWGPDSQTAGSFWQPLVDGRAITNFGNQNYAQLNDESINNLIDELSATQDWSGQERISREVQQRVMEQAVYIPYAFDRISLFRGSKLAHVYVHYALDGHYDVVNVGVN